MYRLLDAVITFHTELVGPGQTIVYDIRILRFFRQGDTWLFRFQFDATVDGRPLLTMREGSAGFFTQGELDAGKGIVQSNMEQRPQAGTRPHDWRELVPLRAESYDGEQLEALRAGDLAKAFGGEFAGLDVERPLTIPGGRMRLVHRVTELDPEGGHYGMGSISAEADIHPDDWFITCHFVDDEVMPGTLMYECCMHTLRIFLLRMGWVAEEDAATWQPILEVKSRLRCRGQVLASTRVVTYEISVRELGYGPEPYAIVDALMYSDGKPIVDLRDMSVRLTGASREGAGVHVGPPACRSGLGSGARRCTDHRRRREDGAVRQGEHPWPSAAASRLRPTATPTAFSTKARGASHAFPVPPTSSSTASRRWRESPSSWRPAPGPEPNSMCRRSTGTSPATGSMRCRSRCCSRSRSSPADGSPPTSAPR